MPAHRQYLSRLESLFRRKRAALLDDLRAALGTASRTTIFRILRAVGYFSSYSHAGRYYTLRRIPEFDGCGLWSWRGIGFSSRGTLRATLVFLIEESPAGQTHEELRQRLGRRVHDTLRGLVLGRAIGREPFPDVSLYLNADPKRAAAIAARLLAAGRSVTVGQVEEVFRRYDVKRTARSRARTSPP